MPTSAQLLRSGLVAAVVVAIAAGCTAPDETPPPTATTSPSPAATEEPASARPVSESGLDCAALISSETAAAVSPDSPTPARDSSEVAWSGTAARVQQAGGLLCEWAAQPSSTDLRDAIEIGALPDAADDYARAIADPELRPDAVDEVGDTSASWCVELAGDSHCAGHVLVGSTWLDVRATLAQRDARDLLTAAMAEAVEAVRSAPGAEQTWSPEPTAVAGDALCTGDAAAERMRGVLGGDVSAVGSGREGEVFPTSRIRVGWSECSWQLDATGRYVTFSVLPGGAWWARDVVVSGGDPFVGDESSVDIESAEAAVLACGAGFCSGRIAIDGSSVQVLGDTSGDDRAAFSEMLGALAASLQDG